MIELLTKTAKEYLPEMTLNRHEVQFIKCLPACPKCKRIDEIIFFNVTKEVYECIKCNQRFHFA